MRLNAILQNGNIDTAHQLLRAKKERRIHRQERQVIDNPPRQKDLKRRAVHPEQARCRDDKVAENGCHGAGKNRAF